MLASNVLLLPLYNDSKNSRNRLRFHFFSRLISSLACNSSPAALPFFFFKKKRSLSLLFFFSCMPHNVTGYYFVFKMSLLICKYEAKCQSCIFSSSRSFGACNFNNFELRTRCVNFK